MTVVAGANCIVALNVVTMGPSGTVILAGTSGWQQDPGDGQLHSAEDVVITVNSAVVIRRARARTRRCGREFVASTTSSFRTAAATIQQPATTSLAPATFTDSAYNTNYYFRVVATMSDGLVQTGPTLLVTTSTGLTTVPVKPPTVNALGTDARAFKPAATQSGLTWTDRAGGPRIGSSTSGTTADGKNRVVSSTRVDVVARSPTAGSFIE